MQSLSETVVVDGGWGR